MLLVRRGSGIASSRPGIALTLAALLVTAACSSASPAARSAAKPTRTGPVLLTFAVYGAPQVITAYTKIAASFSAANPGTVVNIQPYDTHADAIKALDRELQTGTAPDAFLADVTDLPDLVHNGSVQRVDGLLGERHVDFGDGYQRNALEAFSADNALQCMPVDVSPLVVYYNKRLISLAALTNPGDPPITADTGWSMDQFAAAARLAVRRGVRGVYVAPTLQQVAPFVYSGGGHIADDLVNPTTLRFSDGSSSAAMTRLLEVVRDPQLTFSEQQLSHRSALQRFKAGTLGMILGFRNLTPLLREQQDLNFDVMPMPKIGGSATVGSSTGICVSSASDQVAKTADFLAYAISDDATALLTSTGYTVPPNLDVVGSPAFLQPDQLPASASVFPTTVRQIVPLPAADALAVVAPGAERLLTSLFYDPVIDPLDQRLKAIDDASLALLTPTPTPTPTPSPGSSPGSTGSPTAGSN